MKFDLQNKDGLTLKTKGKYVREDIAVGLSESDKSALVPENIVEEASVLGVQGSLKRYEGTFEGEAKVEVNALKRLLDYTKSTSYLFYKNTTITDLTNLINYSDTENVIDMLNMYSGCSKLIKIPKTNTLNVITIGGAYTGCRALTKIQIDTPKVTNFTNAFNGCYKVELIDISYYGVSVAVYANTIFKDCYSLKAIIIRELGSKYAIAADAFNNCYHLLGTVNATYNPNGDKDAYIYVPKNMCDTLKSATNWSTYADQIRALEDYTVDGTTAGELDESKVNA